MDLKLNSVKNIDIPEGRQVGDFIYSGDTLYFELPHHRPCQLSVSFNSCRVEWTPYFKRLPTIFRGGINLDFTVKNLMYLKYLDMNCLMMHGAVVKIGENKEADLLAGYPNCGKTTFCIDAVLNGDKILTDEYSVINQDMYTSRPPLFENSFMNGKQLERLGLGLPLRDKIKMFISRVRAYVFPWLFERGMFFHFDNVFTGSTVLTAKLRKVSVLERGNVHKHDLYQKITAILLNEFNFMGDPVLNAFHYIGEIDLEEYLQKQKGLVYNLIEKTS